MIIILKLRALINAETFISKRVILFDTINENEKKNWIYCVSALIKVTEK
jgi:hypothetical protein